MSLNDLLAIATVLTPLLLGMGTLVIDLITRRRRRAAPTEEPTLVQGMTVLPSTPGNEALILELRRQIGRLEKERRAEEKRADWWRDTSRDHFSREHRDRPIPDYPTET